MGKSKKTSATAISTPDVVSEKEQAERISRYRSLIDIGIALSSEKEVSRILDLILDKARETTQADGASIYLTEQIRIDTIGNAQQKFFPVLRFHRSNNRNTGRKLQNKVLDLDVNSIAGYVAVTGQTVQVENCYKLDESVPYRFSPQNDQEGAYQTISMLAVPIKTSNEKIRGVLQIINKLKPGSSASEDRKNLVGPDDTIPFTTEDAELMQAFASQAASAIENAKLTEDIENLFESFIRASVTAIEARDPATSGHSDRVAVLTVEFARAVHQCGEGVFKDLIFSEQQIRELRYAALLHDFGKIGVRESVLSKRLKLYPHEMETILLRLDSARSRQEMMAWKETAQEMMHSIQQGQKDGLITTFENANKNIDRFAQQMQQVRLSIIKANQPQMTEDDFDIGSLMMWINKTSRELEQPLLTPEEMIKLSLPKGTLGEDERKEIESHVSHTYHFLRQIAWTEDLSGVPDIAHAHHEKCDGSGYPRGLTAEHIPVQSKLMAISDIYDALTSMDRPYKKAAAPDRAIEILHHEARSGKLDMDLLKIFVEAEVYRSADGMRSRKFA